MVILYNSFWVITRRHPVSLTAFKTIKQSSLNFKKELEAVPFRHTLKTTQVNKCVYSTTIQVYFLPFV